MDPGPCFLYDRWTCTLLTCLRIRYTHSFLLPFFLGAFFDDGFVVVIVYQPSFVLNVVHIYFDLDFSTPVPSEPAEVNRDVIYGTVIGILALIVTVFITYMILKHRQRKLNACFSLTPILAIVP